MRQSISPVTQSMVARLSAQRPSTVSARLVVDLVAQRTENLELDAVFRTARCSLHADEVVKGRDADEQAIVQLRNRS